ncbi:uncharacterized protein M6B38_269685 [Iris pallida]|uniref:Uncharacterized protein n=1 Tax=Iris pallida TaxID=29817 RepID=A0AAX6I7P5_IRIPA|nr:uncharacterized protein M6B38_269675 [Iris pallida]KAJ6849251.1 uncharacterized protein M6B38_269680 [Iris pallida]KAJ6849252.1 uncharacterized protein M6B38_269685 [Iris pallida]
MATTSHNPLPLFFFLLLSLPSLLAAGGSIHSLLVSHGLPAGLLPRSVRDFSLDPSTGLLSVRLDRACRADYDRSPVHFDRVVEANLTYGSLSAVTGLSQEELFLWLPVKEISVADQKSGVISFDIGVARKQLSASVFENPPECQPEESGIGYNDILEGGFQKKDQ